MKNYKNCSATFKRVYFKSFENKKKREKKQGNNQKQTSHIGFGKFFNSNF
jgi:hypothetical protein